MKVYFVEIIRYGSEKLGVQPYGIFTSKKKIEKTIIEYNQFRGGKYPAYFVSDIDTEEFENCMGTHRRVRYNIAYVPKSQTYITLKEET